MSRRATRRLRESAARELGAQERDEVGRALAQPTADAQALFAFADKEL